MKTTKWCFALSTALLLVLTACQKDDATVFNFETSEDLTNFHDLMNDTEDYVADNVSFLYDGEETAEIRNNCVEVTFEQPKGTFPNTITIDFGDGCVGSKGRVRSGQIVITQSAPLSEAGASRVSTFVDFFIDDVQLVGSKSLENLGVDENGNITLQRNVEKARIIYPDGTEAGSLNASHTIQQVAGGDTDSKIDDVFEITGEASGVNRNGVAFSSLITDALVKPRNCRWIVNGVKQVTTESGTRTIDYGDGACNNFAIVTLPDGDTKEIRLFRRWWK